MLHDLFLATYLVHRAEAAFSELVPRREVVSGESNGVHVKERDVQVAALTSFVLLAPVLELDRSKKDAGVKRVEPLRALKPPWIAEFRFRREIRLAHGFICSKTVVDFSLVSENGWLGLTFVSEKLVPDEESAEAEKENGR
jgi:hypothetical protein